MKYLSIILVLLLISIAAKASLKLFLLTGTVLGREGQTVELIRDYYGSGFKVLAKTTIQNQQFRFSYEVDEVAPVVVLFKDGKTSTSYNIILEEGHITMNISANGYKIASGGNYNQLLFAYERSKAYQNADSEFKRLTAGGMDKIKGTQTEYEATQFFLKRDELRSKALEEIMNNAKADPKVRIMAATYNSLQPDRVKAMELLEQLAPSIGKESFLVSYARRMNEEQLAAIARRQGIMVGKTYSDFSAANIQGQQVQLSAVVKKNKYTLLQFWASWCVPCRKEIPVLKSLYKAYQDKGFAIVSFSLDDNRINWEKASEKEKFPWPNISDLKAFQSEVMKQYPVNGIPANVIIDQDGNIVASNLVDKELEDKVQTLFKSR